MPELLDEIKALQKSLQAVQADLDALKSAGVKHGETFTSYASKLDALEKARDEIKTALAELKKPAAPPAGNENPKPKEGKDDDDNESGFF